MLEESWKSFGFAKLSRKEFSNLKNSHIIIKENSLPLLPGKRHSASSESLKVIQMTHGPNAFIAKGGMKVYKKHHLIDHNTPLALGKYKDDTEDLEAEYPELPQILVELNGKTNLSGGIYFTLLSHETQKISSYIIANFIKCTLRDKIENGFQQGEKWKFSNEILKGLDYMHQNNIAHRDIKPDNIHILELSDGNQVACLADMDFATKKDQDSKSSTPTHEAPEIFHWSSHSIKELIAADIYSTGLSFYEIFEGKHLWYQPSVSDDLNMKRLNNFRRMTQKELDNLFPEPLPKTIQHLYWEMMSLNSLKRPSSENCLKTFATLPKQD